VDTSKHAQLIAVTLIFAIAAQVERTGLRSFGDYGYTAADCIQCLMRRRQGATVCFEVSEVYNAVSLN
jgi:hypothetical protein